MPKVQSKTGPTTSDLVLESFRKDFPLGRVTVSRDGFSMVYHLGAGRYGADLNWLKRARDIINNNSLPLTAQTFKNVLKGTATLLITYKSAA